MASGAGPGPDLAVGPHVPLVFAGALLVMCVGERLVHAAATLLVALIGGGAPSPRAAKAASARALLLRAADLVVELVRAWAQTLAGLLQWAVYYVLFAAILLLVVYLGGALADADAGLAARLLRVWNGGVGATLRGVLLVPLQALELVFATLVPFWNAVQFFLRGLVSAVAVPALQAQMTTVLKTVTSLQAVFRALAGSLVAYCETVRPCNDAACLAPGERVFDFLSPVLALRVVAVHVLDFLRASCAIATPAAEALLYPVLDANFAQSLHLALNVPLYAVVQVPLVTHARCSQAASFSDARLRGVACVPDFAPVFNMAAASARHAGRLVDNWLDVVWVIVLSAFGEAPPPCQPSALAVKFDTEAQVFGGNETRVVGLGPAAFALTDGLTTQFNFVRGPTETVLARDHWPIQVAPGLGIAAVQYDEAEQVDEGGGRTLSLLGCQCYDVPDTDAAQGTRMELHCAVARFQAEDADEALDAAGLLVPVGFALPSTAQYMTCAGTKITVDSVRWPVSRLSVPGSLGAGGRNFRSPLSAFASDQGDDGPAEVDAVIWLQPACAGDGAFDPVCARTFAGAACFPYCMAARRRGSGSQGLTIYNAEDWQTRVQLQGRDCAVASVGTTLAPGQEYTTAAAPAGYGLLVEDSNDPLGRRLAQTGVFDPATLACVASDSVMSRVNRTAIADIDERYEAVLLEGQPFAVAGSAALIAVYNTDGSVGVKVQRLYGEEGTESFSIVTTHSELPALPPCETLSACDQLPRDDLVSIPYAWTASPGRHNPAVETRWGVLYAVNPSLDMFSEFAKYCQGRTDYNLQIQALSSYGGIRIWRMDAFAHTERNGDAAARGASVEMPGVFLSQTNDTSICGSAFNVIVTSMEYLSEENVAVTVLHAAPAYLDMRTLSPLGNDPQQVRYRTYFLQPQTLQVREDEPWLPDTATAQLRAGASTLCPDWRNMPQLGSLVGEVGAGAALGTRMWVSLFTALPVLFQDGMLARLRECPMTHMSHSLLLNCGRGLLSLDDAFAAFRKANAHFFMVVAKLGRLLRGLPGGESMNSFLQGVAMSERQKVPALLRRRDFKHAAAYAANPADYVRGRVHEYALQQYAQLQKQLSDLPDRVQQMRTELSARTVRFAREVLERSREAFAEQPTLAGMQASLFDGYRSLFGAPPRNLFARLPGGSFGVKALGASALDVGQFFWRAVTRLLLELLARDAVSQPLAPLVWHAFVESKHDFGEFFVLPAFRACSGLGVMLGSSNPWARLMRESCSAAVAQQATLLTTVEVFFVMTPVLACLCRDPGGQNFETYATNVCWAGAPEHLKPMVAALVSAHAGRVSELSRTAVCDSMGLHVEERLRGALDPAMAHAHQAAQALAGFVDYATVLWDPDAGRCADLLGSPYTMAIVPEPYDYFEGCRRTQSCRSACAGPFDAFDAVRERLQDLGTEARIKQTVVNSFFSPQEILEGRAAPPFQVHGVMQVPVMDVSAASGRACCGGVSPADRCVAVVGTTDRYAVEVVEYCVPARLGVGTHEHVRWEVAGSSAWAPDLRSIAFASRAHLIAAFADRVVMYRANGDAHVVLETLAPGAVAAAGQPAMHRVAWVLAAPNNFALVHGFVVRPGAATAEPVALVVRLEAPRAWPNFFPAYSQTDLDRHLHGHMATCLTEQCHDFLLLPNTQSGAVRRCAPDPARHRFPSRLLYACADAALDPGLALVLGLRQDDGPAVGLTQSATPFRKAVVLSQNALEPRGADNERRVFLSAPLATASSWLQEVRVEWDERPGSPASAQKAAAQRTELDVALRRQCSVDDCAGCRVPAVQRACYAASQCAVARCIGTVVNLERPLCSAGGLLQTSMELSLVKYQGIWTTVSEIVILVLRLATGRGSDGGELERLDVIFFALLCEAKDGIVGSVSLLTSLVNSVVNQIDRAVRAAMPVTTAQDQGAVNAGAVRALGAAATTNMLAQLALGVLYPPVVAKKTVLCHTEAFLNAVVGAAGYELRLENRELAEATNAITSRCLSEYHKEAMREPEAAEAGGGFSEVVNELVGESVTAVGQVPFESVLHTLDAGFAWLQGVVSGVMDVLATADQRHCNLPDNQADTVQTCACGDAPLMIPLARAREGVADGAFWCAGALSLVNSMGEAFLAFNPYSYQQILDELDGSDAYLQCVSSSYADTCAHLRPGAGLPLLAQQGVSVFTAAVRCKSNYVNSQWDEGAAALFVADDSPAVRHFLGVAAHLRTARAAAEAALPPAVAACLRLSLAEGAANDACLQDFLAARGERAVGYFEYTPVPDGLVGSQHIAGCQVFTGPAGLAPPPTAARFAACLDDADATGCSFPPMVWAGRSANRVPVASEHALVADDAEGRAEQARREHAQTHTRVQALLDADELRAWQADALDLSLFTAEGDALHQLFDAMVLGPYARADLWPRDAEGALPTLEWFRDAHGGRTREFELPCAGAALRNETSSPYTCGSDARRAAIRYFVRDVFFGKNERSLKEGVERAVRELLNDLRTAWGARDSATDPRELPYGCACERTDDAPPRHDVACCAQGNTTAFLPAGLHRAEYTTLRSESLVRELFELAGRFVDRDLFSRHAAPFTTHSQAGPLWGRQHLRQAAALGVMRAHKGLLAYDEAEVGAPLGWLDAAHSPNVSLWAHCHGLLQQSLATLPVALSGSLRGLDEAAGFDPLDSDGVAGAQGFASALEALGERVSAEAWLRAPVYWSHVMRHLPSDSLVCDAWHAGAPGDAWHAGAPGDEAMQDADVARATVDGVDVLGDDFALGALGRTHRHAGALGAAARACLCGWAVDGGCYVPHAVCQGVAWAEKAGQARDGGRADAGLDELEARCAGVTAGNVAVPRPARAGAGAAVRDAVLAHWQDGWQCDSMRPSASWGLYNHDATDDWLAEDADLAGRFSAQEALLDGRSGVRAGNIQRVLAGEWSTLLHPGAQRRPPARGAASVGQRWCQQNVAEHLPPSYHGRWVDELFPMAQSVAESAPIAACVRVAVEAARLRLLRLAAAGAAGAAQAAALAHMEAQEATMRRWRRQCLQQLDAVALCSLRGVFDSPPVDEPEPACPFALVNLPPTGAWVAGNCILRWPDARHYDPCRCVDTCGPGAAEIDATAMVADAACRPLPDPRRLVAPARQDASLHWPAQYTHVTDGDARAELEALAGAAAARKVAEQLGADALRIVEEHAARARADAPAPDADAAFGNAPPGAPWPAAEGPAAESTLFCDAIHDWWPEAWDSPPGVHPTTPCGSDEAAYRGFANSFSLDRAFEPPRLVYRHAALTNRSLGTNHFGVVGACRARTFGLPLQDFNNMRFCTRLDVLARADPAVPVPPEAPPVHGEGEDFRFLEACGARSTDVPWAIRGGVWQTAGLLLAWPENADGPENAALWPPEDLLARDVQHPAAAADGWGAQTCGLPQLQTCAADADCERGELAAAGVNMRCMGGSDAAGVCVVAEQRGGVVQCSRHADCGEHAMCDGEGRCVDPVVAFNNTLWHDLLAHARAESCLQGERRETFGRSPWEQVPDLLRAHGLCSHRSWFEYRQLLDAAGCPAGSAPGGENVCPLHVDRVARADTRMMGPAAVAGRTLREEGVLAVQAHPCDRDFMYAEGFAECLPRTVVRRDGLGRAATPADGAGDHGDTFATYRQRDNETIPFARLPHTGNGQLGFLGIDLPLQSKEDDISARQDGVQLASCASIPHCSVQPFTVRGMDVATPRVVVPDFQAAREYTVRDAVKCGAYGFLLHTAPNREQLCLVDKNVVPMLAIVCDHGDALEDEQCKFAAAPTRYERTRLCQALRETYSPAQKGEVGEKVNSLLLQFARWNSAPGSGDTLTQYWQQLRCAEGILGRLNQPRGPTYTTADDREITSVGLYWFTTPAENSNGMSLYEIAPLWFVRCMLFSSDVALDAASACPAWTGGVGLTESSHEWLALRAGEFAEVDVHREREYLQSNITAALQALLETLHTQLANATHPGTPLAELFNPVCSNRTALDMERVTRERESPSTGSLLQLLQTHTLQEGMLDGSIGDFPWEQSDACRIVKCVTHDEPFVHVVACDPAASAEAERCRARRDVAGALLQAFTRLDDIEVQDDLRAVEVIEDQIHLFRVHAAEGKTATVLQRVQELEEDSAGACFKDESLDEAPVCLYSNVFDDPQANTNSWVTYHDTNMHVMFSRDVQNLPRFSTPWARHPHGGVLFDVCTDERHPFEREGGGKRAAMRSTCGIPADTSPLCSSGAGWASAFSGSGNAEYCSWLDARFHGVAAADRQPKERCYDVNDECLSEGPIPRTRPVNAASVVFDEVEHDANQYKSVRLPRGVTLRVKFRASGASLAQGEMRSIARIDNVAPPAFPEGLAPPDGGPGWSKVGGSVQRDDVMFSWSPFLGENDFKFLRSYALGDGPTCGRRLAVEGVPVVQLPVAPLPHLHQRRDRRVHGGVH